MKGTQDRNLRQEPGWRGEAEIEAEAIEKLT